MEALIDQLLDWREADWQAHLGGVWGGLVALAGGFWQTVGERGDREWGVCPSGVL